MSTFEIDSLVEEGIGFAAVNLFGRADLANVHALLTDWTHVHPLILAA